jgi:hypothetical protein
LSIKRLDDPGILGRRKMGNLRAERFRQGAAGFASAIETGSHALWQPWRQKVETDCRLRFDLTVFAEMTYFTLDSVQGTAMIGHAEGKCPPAERLNKQGL